MHEFREFVRVDRMVHNFQPDCEVALERMDPAVPRGCKETTKLSPLKRKTDQRIGTAYGLIPAGSSSS